LKILTILGTRPEVIRLSIIINKLDCLCDHILIHTGQNYDPRLHDIFFDQLGVRRPDKNLGVKGDSFGDQIGQILNLSENVFKVENPDRILILGDTNSGLSAIGAKRLGIPVFHMEAGNRCYDDRVPEEVNRRLIDHSSDILLPYTERSRQNLIREGISGQRIYVTGNPIYEVINHFTPLIEKSSILASLGLEPRRYFLVTMHRAENVDIESRLHNLTTSLDLAQKQYSVPIIVSTHPRTRKQMQKFSTGSENEHIKYLAPFGFFDFIMLEQNAMCVLSDSGTVQEECAIFGVPTVTIRDVTERPETLECGSNILSGADPQSVLKCIDIVLNLRSDWNPPVEYIKENVSDTVIKILFGYLHVN
jgi:UDP-N-acetylglucosamine 2-epimerase (non-hydrolysing)